MVVIVINPAYLLHPFYVKLDTYQTDKHTYKHIPDFALNTPNSVSLASLARQ